MTKQLISDRQDEATYYTTIKFNFTEVDDGINGSVQVEIPHFPVGTPEEIKQSIDNRGVSELRVLLDARKIKDEIVGKFQL